MADRTSTDWKSILEELKTAAGRVVQGGLEQAIRHSPALLEGFKTELKTLSRHPRSLGFLLEGSSPWLTRRFLGAASNWSEPFTVGMGFRVEKLGEDLIEVGMPGFWRNQGDAGQVHSGALASLGEFAVRLYWEYHLDLTSAGAEASRVQVRVLARPVGEMKAVFRLPVADREAILHRLRADGRTEVETQALVYDRDGRLVAEVEVDWRLCRQMRLQAPIKHDDQK